MSNTDNILITGAAGQLGVELTTHLRARYGADKVIATDIRKNKSISDSGPFEELDVLDQTRLAGLVRDRGIGTIYHLAAILSAKGEANIQWTWKLNMDGLLNVLEVVRERMEEGKDDAAEDRNDSNEQVSTQRHTSTQRHASTQRHTSAQRHASTRGMQIFWPSSIAVFGPDLPREQTPQNSPLNPTTVYGITKVAGEQLCAYYHRRFGVDVRSVRYPGLIGNKSEPGGGTTDYAVDMLLAASRGEAFTSPLKPDTRLPMMFMDDAVKAATELMDADGSKLRVRTSYNLTAMSFSPGELRDAIREHVDGFDVAYRPDHREEIAASWPDSIDDSHARRDWKWEPGFDLKAMVREMLPGAE